MSTSKSNLNYEEQNQTHSNEPLPRPERKRRRASEDKGLPPDSDLEQLAIAYLDRQRQHWPELVAAGLLPRPTKLAVRTYVEDFKTRHRTGDINLEKLAPFSRVEKLAGAYSRYSCDNSASHSNLDQLVNILDRAKSEGRLVPWAYVFCDYSVSGLNPSRRGYSSYKSTLADETHFIETTYIDDFTRASRDEIEWWRLAGLSKRLNKRMIGASDGFDLNSGHSDVLITMFGLLSRQFVKQLREKVKRGMKGAARRGTCLGKLSLGFTRKVLRDENGNIVRRPDERPRHEPCVDPETKQYRLLIYELFIDRGLSPNKIAQHYNELKVDGSDGWTTSAIKKLLLSPTAIGVFIWNRTRNEFDPEEGKWRKHKNPRSEWEVFFDPKLAIVSLDQYRAARKKLSEMRRNSPLTGRKRSRNQVCATTLFSGTLFCEHCSKHAHGTGELKLIRSTQKYRQMGCLNGVQKTHGCPLSSSKSARIIEECLLPYLRENLLTESSVSVLLDQVNAYIDIEARKPDVDTKPINSNARKLEAKIDKLVRRVEDEPDEDVCNSYDRRIKELQNDLKPLVARIRDAELKNRQKKTEPISMDDIGSYLVRLRELLNQDIPMAAEAIRTLTGPISIRQENVEGRSRPRWVASFAPDLMQLLRQVADNEDLPAFVVLENSNRDAPETVELPIEHIPKYEQLALQFKKLRDNGASIESIANAHKISWQYAKEILHFAETGERPKWKSRRNTAENRRPPGTTRRKYLDISDEVSRLRDQNQWSFRHIAEHLGVGQATVRRANDHVHHEATREAANNGETPKRGKYSHLDVTVPQQIRELLARGLKPADIASQVDCSVTTVHRVRKEMKSDITSEESVA